ncbi:MAG: fused MFS/spermidine synthase [Kiritimatiellae bacterium]|nr:fused MFS/spermidine synthase [Kiritimatiellia bacterium]
MPQAVIFLGSFLLFLIQPMLGRTLLPIFGGSAAVWGVCLAAYQTLLLAGYFYAHRMADGNLRRNLKVHASLLVFAALWVFAVALARPFLNGLFGHSAWPWLESPGCVLFLAGIPYVLLSAGSTLVQAASSGSRNVYRLYAFSNAGSLIGLLIYPFVFERSLGLTLQWWIFGGVCLVYAIAMSRFPCSVPSAVAGRPRDSHGPAADRANVSNAENGDTGTGKPLLWLVLPGVFSFLLNAVIAHLFLDVTPLPFVWILMLSLFLAAYIAGFSRLGGWRPRLWALAGLVSIVAAVFAARRWGQGSFYPNAYASGAVLFFVGTMLTGWLYQSRPGTDRLTRFYLYSAIGGAAGGLLASFAAPLVFTRVTEFPLALIVSSSLCAVRLFPSGRHARLKKWLPALTAATAACLLFLLTSRATGARQLYRSRNFYGSLGVTQTREVVDGMPAPVSYLWYGQTTHGLQVRTNALRSRPFGYYMRFAAGVGILSHPKYRDGRPMNVGVVGLGAGMLLPYGRANDLYRFFEINPHVIRIAQDPRYFTYMADAACKIDLVPGDARKSLEQETANGDPLYDLLVIDAYSGDAVPYHLITKEAFELYLSRLAPDGILAVHISNWHIDLAPICKAVAETLNLCLYGVRTVGDTRLMSSTVWTFFSRQGIVYVRESPDLAEPIEWNDVRAYPLPTDDKGSLLGLLR